ncbi:hypothetical protein QBC39DRAFT_358825 [Podospora conica]|nr:hypothetical protein QBC39DRAFT_358825 [Schizothecium conicum]
MGSSRLLFVFGFFLPSAVPSSSQVAALFSLFSLPPPDSPTTLSRSDDLFYTLRTPRRNLDSGGVDLFVCSVSPSRRLAVLP